MWEHVHYVTTGDRELVNYMNVNFINSKYAHLLVGMPLTQGDSTETLSEQEDHDVFSLEPS